MIEKLFNYGIKSFNNTTKSKQKTIIVIGTARGGTSMIAGILYHLGIPMGGATEPVFEDVRLASAFETENEERIKKIVDEYNSSPIWAYKRPASVNYLLQLANSVRNPHFVFIFRDILSIANRNSISMGSNVISAMDDALNDYGKIMKFISENNFPFLMCSSEKTNLYPQQVVEALIDFTDITVSKEVVSAAVNFIDPESSEYLNASRITRSHGQIGQVKNNVIRGWAAWFYRDDATTVQVYVNDVLVAEKVADEFRPHLANEPKTRKGYCGYSIDVSHADLNKGDELIVKVKSDVMQLKNSPWIN
jgi:hypothetical protein